MKLVPLLGGDGQRNFHFQPSPQTRYQNQWLSAQSHIPRFGYFFAIGSWKAAPRITHSSEPRPDW